MSSLAYALRDGAILAVAASTVVMGALRYNPRLFMRHFPQALRERIPPLSPQEVRAGSVVGGLLMACLVLGPLVSTWMLAEREPAASFGGLALHAFAVGMLFNLVDWLVLDELWLGVLQPGWALPPGATQDDFRPWDHRRHALGFVTGTGLCAVVGLASAGIVRALG